VQLASPPKQRMRLEMLFVQVNNERALRFATRVQQKVPLPCSKERVACRATTRTVELSAKSLIFEQSKQIKGGLVGVSASEPHCCGSCGSVLSTARVLHVHYLHRHDCSLRAFRVRSRMFGRTQVHLKRVRNVQTHISMLAPTDIQ
jgi:hypothetical protein